ncbi:iron reductase [Herbaspirillum seropedicae]|nr:iron reductase [Herbaspirillum seropedicae]
MTAPALEPAQLAPSSVLPILAPLFDQRTAAYAARLVCDASSYAQALPLPALLEASALDDAVRRHAAHWRSDDLRAAASAWCLDYFAAMLVPAMAAAAVLRHHLPLAAAQLRVVLAPHGGMAQVCLPHAGHPWPQASPPERYEELVWQHLAPVIAALNKRFRTPSAVLWGNAVRYIHAVLQRGVLLALPSQEGLAEDRRLLLDSPLWPDGRTNPLYHRRAVPPAGVDYLHRNCCMYYRLPGEDYCAACPLRSRHDKRASD